MNNVQKQAGVTLIELMVGLTIGLFVIGGVLTVYMSTLQSSSSTLKQSRLNQEITTLVNIMSTDIRRAGYWANATPTTSPSNPFSQEGSTALDVLDSSTNVSAGNTGSGNCITYTYDADDDGAVDLDELYGFKLIGTDIWMRNSCDNGGTDDCAAATADSCTLGNWERITDPNTIQVNSLVFDLANSECVNANVDNTNAANDCYAVVPAAGSEESTAEIRQVDIGLNAELISDSLVDASMNITVRVRNDLITIH